MGKSNLGVGEAMVIKPCNAIHTFFMRFPIDVLFVDKHNKVVKAISNLPAFRLTSICFASQFVVELPSGTIKATHTVSGDQLTVGY